jgi:hypothetical protein
MLSSLSANMQSAKVHKIAVKQTPKDEFISDDFTDNLEQVIRQHKVYYSPKNVQFRRSLLSKWTRG